MTGAGPSTVLGLRGRDLSGRAVRLPQDLPHDPTLVLVGFTEDQQDDLDRWAQALPGVESVEVVVIPAPLERRRRVIEGGMAVFIRAADSRARTWCVYGDVDAWLTHLDVPDRRSVLAMVLRPDGGVRALAAGPPTAQEVERLRTALPAAG